MSTRRRPPRTIDLHVRQSTRRRPRRRGAGEDGALRPPVRASSAAGAVSAGAVCGAARRVTGGAAPGRSSPRRASTRPPPTRRGPRRWRRRSTARGRCRRWARLRAGVGAVEPLEHPLGLLGGQARPVVGDLERRRSRPPAGSAHGATPHRHRRARGRVRAARCRAGWRPPGAAARSSPSTTQPDRRAASSRRRSTVAARPAAGRRRRRRATRGQVDRRALAAGAPGRAGPAAAGRRRARPCGSASSSMRPSSARRRSSGSVTAPWRYSSAKPADRRERRAQLVAGVGDEAAHALLGPPRRASDAARARNARSICSSMTLSARPSRPTSVRGVGGRARGGPGRRAAMASAVSLDLGERPQRGAHEPAADDRRGRPARRGPTSELDAHAAAARCVDVVEAGRRRTTRAAARRRTAVGEPDAPATVRRPARPSTVNGSPLALGRRRPGAARAASGVGQPVAARRRRPDASRRRASSSVTIEAGSARCGCPGRRDRRRGRICCTSWATGLLDRVASCSSTRSTQVAPQQPDARTTPGQREAEGDQQRATPRCSRSRGRAAPALGPPGRSASVRRGAAQHVADAAHGVDQRRVDARRPSGAGS